MPRFVLALLLHCCVAAATNTDYDRPGISDEQATMPIRLPDGVQLFDLHDPELGSNWPSFLATTPMLNNQLLPVSLQQRLAGVVNTYRTLTPVGDPAFFVATYFDLLSERLLAKEVPVDDVIQPLQVCSVFASGATASVGQLLSVASGLSARLFVNAPGRQDRYRYLFLQTEFSHCRFLRTVSAAEGPAVSDRLGGFDRRNVPNIAFRVGRQNYNAFVGSTDELRAVLETVGDIDAIMSFRTQWPIDQTVSEADVLCFVRLLSLLATESQNGYSAIPVLFPMLSAPGEQSGHPVLLTVGDAMEVAYRLRATFREWVPYGIHDTNDLLRAKLSVMQGLADATTASRIDAEVSNLLEQFVIGSDLLLTPKAAP
ncbi:MAG TPA: hypothetical protein PKK10_11240 [Woeseiaceae bacterium]|nr:hypothetical protein [Woeseiaceae bacterium]